MRHELDLERRRLLGLLVAAPFASVLLSRLMRVDDAAAAEARHAAVDRGRAGAPTPECGDDDEPTPPQTEGPFYKLKSPKRHLLLEDGIPGTRLELTGRVFGRDCHPLAGVLLDFWHADGEGHYDNDGFRLRGHQFTDAEGRYHLTSVLPGLYPGRTRHFHVRVQPRGGKILTTQLYFPGEARNLRDRLFEQDLLVALDEGGSPQRARFHFVLDTA